MNKVIVLILSHLAVFAAGYGCYGLMRKGNDARAQSQATRLIAFATLAQCKAVIAETKQSLSSSQTGLAVQKLDIMDKVIDNSIGGLGQITPLSPPEQDLLRVVLPHVGEEPASQDESVPAGARRRVVLPP